MVVEPNHAISPNTIIEPRDVVFDETRISSSPRPRELDQEPIDPTSSPRDCEDEEVIAPVPRFTRSLA